MIEKPQSTPPAQAPGDDYRTALEAIREALDIPNGATTGDQEARDPVLLERVGHATVMLRSILDGSHPTPDIPWSVAYLRARLAEHPAVGYKTWAERMAEPDAAKAQDPASEIKRELEQLLPRPVSAPSETMA